MSNSKIVNIVIFGVGKVGSTLINQINCSKPIVFEQEKITINIPVIANSEIALYSTTSVSHAWQSDFELFSIPYRIEDIIRFTKLKKLENLIAIDATASSEFVNNYGKLIENGFDIVSANKKANTMPFEFYRDLREKLDRHNRNFLYETNVGAGLPIIETIRNLHRSGDDIYKIRGVFSGTLSYIFNTFSNGDLTFSKVIDQASNLGLTEPDVREDLSGQDVGRKLLILARELGIRLNIEDVEIESLVPSHLNGKTTIHEFNQRKKELNRPFERLKEKAGQNNVLRYVAELTVANRSLEVKLIEEDKNSAIGRLTGSNSLFEVYSSSYNEEPLIIQGAGAGKEVTARGLISDILKIANTLN